MFTTCKITARLSTSRQMEISYNLLGNVLHAQVNGKHMDLVKELLTTAENQRHIRFKKQARYKLHKIVTKTEGKGREMRSKQQNHAQ